MTIRRGDTSTGRMLLSNAPDCTSSDPDCLGLRGGAHGFWSKAFRRNVSLKYSVAVSATSSADPSMISSMRSANACSMSIFINYYYICPEAYNIRLMESCHPSRVMGARDKDCISERVR